MRASYLVQNRTTLRNMLVSFSSLLLSDTLLSVLVQKGYIEPTPIQLAAIPAILSGQDLMASAQTGTGKTAAFTLPLLQTLIEKTGSERSKVLRVLVLVPTRELALQVNKSMIEYAVNTDIKSTVIYGGVSIDAQAVTLAAGVDIVVATPGRLLDQLRRGLCRYRQLKL